MELATSCQFNSDHNQFKKIERVKFVNKVALKLLKSFPVVGFLHFFYTLFSS